MTNMDTIIQILQKDFGFFKNLLERLGRRQSKALKSSRLPRSDLSHIYISLAAGDFFYSHTIIGMGGLSLTEEAWSIIS